MKLAFTPQAWADYSYWQETDPQISARIRQLIKDSLRDPHRGIGKPEPLKQALQGCWSRRITGEHRMVYQVSKGELLIMQEHEDAVTFAHHIVTEGERRGDDTMEDHTHEYDLKTPLPASFAEQEIQFFMSRLALDLVEPPEEPEIPPGEKVSE